MWSVITSILYLECAIVGLLVFPVVSVNQWQKLISSNAVRAYAESMKPWICVYIILMAYLLLSSLLVMKKTISPDILRDEELLLEYNFKQTLAQRNFYISGASIFMTALIRRLILIKNSQVTNLKEIFTTAVENNVTETSEHIDFNHFSSAIDIASSFPFEEDDSKVLSFKKEYSNWTDIDDWGNRKRLQRITANIVREEKNNNALKLCAKRLNNFCLRLDEDYEHLQNIIGKAYNVTPSE